MRLSDTKELCLSLLNQNFEMSKEDNPRLSNRSIVPMLESVPGIGKTSIVSEIAKETGARLITVRLSDREPTDVTGWHVPNIDNTGMIHIRPDWLPTGDEGPVIIFFDEISQGSTAAQNTVAQCVNERKVGAKPVPNNTHFICAGNATKDRAGTNHMPTHLRDRLTWIEVEANAEDTCNYFSNIGVDTRLIAYLRFRSEMLSKFDRDAKACPSPRSWERTDTVLKANLPPHLRTVGIAGNVGDGAANDFTGYLRLVEAVPDMDALIKDPANAPMPTDIGILYAVATELTARYTKDNASAIATYLTRLPQQDIAAFAVGDLIRKHKREVATNKDMLNLMSKLGDQLTA